jgi:hypothetical protein
MTTSPGWIMHVTSEEHALAKAVKARAAKLRESGTYDPAVLVEGLKEIFGAETTELLLTRKAKLVERSDLRTIPPGERFVQGG